MKTNNLIYSFTIFISLSILLFVSGCDKKKDYSYNSDSKQEIIERILDNPDSALIIINTAVENKHITPEFGEYLYAIYNFYITNNYEYSIYILNKLRSNKKDIQKYSTTKDCLYPDILVLLTQSYFQLGNYSYAMHYAKEASTVCRAKKTDKVFLSSEMDCIQGYILCKIGYTRIGLKRMDEALDFTSKSNHFLAFHSRLDCINMKLAVLYSLDSCQNIISTCNKYITEIQNSENLDNIPNSYLNNNKLNDFKDIHIGLLLAYKSSALAKLGQYDSSKIVLEQCLKTKWGKAHETKSPPLFKAYANLGYDEKLSTTLSYFRNKYKNDSARIEVVQILEERAMMALKNKDTASAYDFTARAKNIQSLIFKQEISNQIKLNNKLYKDKLKEKQKKEIAELRTTVIVVHIVIFLLIIISALHLYYHNKKVKQLKNAYKLLMEKQSIIDSNINIVTSVNTEKEKQHSVLYDRILQVMETSKPYLKEDFTINTLAELVNSNVSYVSHAINFITGKTFPQWLADYRNHIAIKALQKNTNLTINEICILTGHNTRETFSRQFKALNSMSFSEFKEQIKNDSNT